ncbi:DUF4359 domain-containing protein [Argonema galeatum]|uniref:DUF4359 domain-containing protein n=1 Tax=Argonema galeatum TaxID=2942762 RepID=UPI00201295B4|nr:DUF4359 domain-containing protein [Argonema galeatum]MCL1468340.1 DUF4359 domain-containing protein [Argonema galeatum A003/A1]
MKSLNILKSVGILALAGLGLSMALGNPSQSDYEEYALAQLTVYLKNNVCTEAPKGFHNFLARQCTILVDTGRPKLKRIVAENTYQLNFIFFSIYRTELSISPFLPGYRFGTVGAFQNFYIYQAEKQ